jgi:glycosyltransferase involved in cell wall biosynthesis
VDTAYVAANISQPWNYQVRSDRDFLLPGGFFRATMEIHRRLASGRYALVHLAGWGHPVLLAALFLVKLHRIPVTIESDTHRPPTPSVWKSIIKRLFFPWLFSLPNHFLPAGKRQAAYLQGYGVPARRIQIMQMTVDVEQIKSQVEGRRLKLKERFRGRFGISQHAVCALYVGRLETYKGIEDLLGAHRRVACPVILLIIGDGSLRNIVLGAETESEWIRYAGRLEGGEILEAYCAADFLVVPSRSEQWGLVVNEAMAVGLPVIISDRVGCIDDLVADEVTGLVVPAESPARLAEAIARLADNADLRTRMEIQGSRLISAWTLANQAANTTTVWSRLLQ